MKTIALKERTFELLRELKEKKKSESFDELVLNIIIEKENIAASMRGSLKGKTKRFTSKERDKLWRDKHREW